MEVTKQQTGCQGNFGYIPGMDRNYFTSTVFRPAVGAHPTSIQNILVAHTHARARTLSHTRARTHKHTHTHTRNVVARV